MLAAILIMALGALILGAALGYASIKFKVEGNPLVEKIEAILPQTQCGQCGYPGCKPYAEAIAEGRVPELAGYAAIKREVRYGENSRIDILLTHPERPRCLVEIKNVHLRRAEIGDGCVAEFPDAVTERGTKHLREMMEMVRQGHRALLVFCVQRGDARAVRPADHIDPVYGRTLREALAAGVEAVALRATVTPEEIRLSERLPVVTD